MPPLTSLLYPLFLTSATRLRLLAVSCCPNASTLLGWPAAAVRPTSADPRSLAQAPASASGGRGGRGGLQHTATHARLFCRAEWGAGHFVEAVGRGGARAGGRARARAVEARPPLCSRCPRPPRRAAPRAGQETRSAQHQGLAKKPDPPPTTPSPPFYGAIQRPRRTGDRTAVGGPPPRVPPAPPPLGPTRMRQEGEGGGWARPGGAGPAGPPGGHKRRRRHLGL